MLSYTTVGAMVPSTAGPSQERQAIPLFKDIMKTNLLFAAVLCGATFFAGCEYDDGYAVRRVSVTTGTPYYGNFNEYTPYYSYSGRRYYRTGNRYVYYTDRRPFYVTTLPSRAVYITPPRHTTVSRVVRHHHRDWDDDD